MQDDGQRMLVAAHPPYEVVRDAGTKRGDNSQDKIKDRNTRVDLLHQQHAQKRDSVKHPLHRSNFLIENENKNKNETEKDENQEKNKDIKEIENEKIVEKIDFPRLEIQKSRPLSVQRERI